MENRVVERTVQKNRCGGFRVLCRLFLEERCFERSGHFTQLAGTSRTSTLSTQTVSVNGLAFRGLWCLSPVLQWEGGLIAQIEDGIQWGTLNFGHALIRNQENQEGS